MNFDLIAFLVFIVIISIFLIFKRKNLVVQKLIFPVFYMLMYRTSLGLKLMDKVSSKYRGLVRFFGYCFIGIGFAGMIYVSFAILLSMVKFFIAPKVTEVGMSLVLPGTNIPGIGYLSFFHFLIAIFFLAIVHEFAHGVMIRAYDLEVKSSGFAFFSIFLPILPAAFVEPNEKKMAKREDYVQYSILAAGPVANILVSFVFAALLLWVVAPIEDRITDHVGFSFNATPNYPAAVSGISSRILIDNFNGEYVVNADKFLEKMRYCSKPNDTIVLGSGNKTFNVVAAEHPQDASKGFIGVEKIENEVRVKPGYEKSGKVLYWFKWLFWWLYILNISIGFVNLLPIYITDGGKMLLIAFQSFCSDKKKVLKFWHYINLLFVLLVVIGTTATYLKQFGLF
jgi:membrane-associated protease RseP (regulator of RpoE activity)